jgi:transcriptional regulator with XRE-family HTH domain
MSKCYNSLREDLIQTAADKEYRHAYAEENLNLSIATQIKILREQREMTQETLAEEAEMTQSMISRYENVNYSSWGLNTLRKLAKAFDVYLEVKFRSFREMIESVENFNREALQVPRFTEDAYFSPMQPAISSQINAVASLGITAGVASAIGAPTVTAQMPMSDTDVGSANSAAHPMRSRLQGSIAS